MAGIFYARVPAEIETKIINKMLDKLNTFSEHQKAVMEAEYDEYKRRTGVGEALLPYYVWVLVMYELYIKEEA